MVHQEIKKKKKTPRKNIFKQVSHNNVCELLNFSGSFSITAIPPQPMKDIAQQSLKKGWLISGEGLQI